MENIDDLMVFAKVVELQSFTEAANVLKISRSLVSKRITQLEARMAVQLLVRTTRKLNLTQAGHTLYGYCRQIQETLTQAEQALGSIRHQPHGRLTICASVTFGQMYLADIISHFLQRYPQVDVRLSLSDGKTDLIGGGFDLAVRIGTLEDSSLKARKIGQMRQVALASEQYLKTRGTPQYPEDLQHHNCLTYKHMGDRENYWKFTDDNGEVKVKVNGNFNADNGMPLLMSAASGLGIAYIPDFMLNAHLEKQLVRVLPDYCRNYYGIYAVYPGNRQESLNTRVFIDFLAEHYQNTHPS